MRYISKLFPDSTNQQLHSQKITYTYDSMNRRVARTDENGTTQYLYGNPNHPFQLTAVCSPSGSLSRYHYDDFGLLFALERDNNWYYITTDQLGTPRVVCDANGELVKVLEYDSFGQVIADCYPEFELHISFAGGLIDVETELVRFGFRDYDAVAGKWTAKDPIGFAGGDGNLYGYILNDPCNQIDSHGLIPRGMVPNYVVKNVQSTVNNITGNVFTQREINKITDIIIEEIDLNDIPGAKNFKDVKYWQIPLIITGKQKKFINAILDEAMENSKLKAADKELVSKAKQAFEKAQKTKKCLAK